jgi:DNA-nicking Smr family endonuclease
MSFVIDRLSRMSISEQDRKLWLTYVADVKPMNHTHVIPSPHPIPRIKQLDTTHVSPILDLHGMTLSEAHAAVSNHVMHMKHKFTYVTVITGKSGIMRDQLPSWLSHMNEVRSCESDRGGGAYRITFKRDNYAKPDKVS